MFIQSLMSLSVTTTTKKGFITLYFLSLLMLIIAFSCSYLRSINNYLYYRESLDAFRRMNNAEVLTVMRIKKAFDDYSEQDETLTYKGCIIDITYDGLNAEIAISYNGYLRERSLTYDPDSQAVKEYH